MPQQPADYYQANANPTISRLRSETWWAGMIAALTPVVLGGLVQGAVIDEATATWVGSVVTTFAGGLTLYGRNNGNKPLRAFKPMLGGQ